jgi:hypothetical protein
VAKRIYRELKRNFMNLQNKLLVVFVLLYSVFSTNVFAQQKKRFSIEINYGANCNFFVKSYDEKYAPSVEHLYLYKKKMIGSSGGVELRYNISKYASLIAGYSRTVNSRRRSGGVINNNLLLQIDDFNLRHINNFFTVGYERPFSKKNTYFLFNVGLVYLTSQQQEITIDKFSNESGTLIDIRVQDRNKKNSGLEEGGIFTGLSFQKPIGEKFYLGIKTRGYYLVSSGTFEAITLTPFLVYHF